MHIPIPPKFFKLSAVATYQTAGSVSVGNSVFLLYVGPSRSTALTDGGTVFEITP